MGDVSNGVGESTGAETPSTGWSRARRNAREVLSQLWLIGLGTLLVALGLGAALAAGISGKERDWVIFIVVGAGVSAVTLFGPLVANRFHARWRLDRWQAALGLVAILGIAATSLAIGLLVGWMQVIIPAALALLGEAALGRGVRVAPDGERLAIADHAAAILIAWWGWLSVWGVAGMMQSPLASQKAAAFLALGFTLLAFRPALGKLKPPGRWAMALGCVAIVLMSLRTELLFSLGPEAGEHHWGAWVGPAELIRQGGWLLWDAPSMYGTLSVATLAALPVPSPWQSFYLLQAAAMVAAAIGVFFAARWINGGWSSWILALAVACGILMFIGVAGETTTVIPVQIYPNFGPYRYLFCTLLLGVAAAASFAAERPRRMWMTCGTMLWVLGVFWSPESAMYSTAVWLPAYGALVFREGMVNTRARRRVIGWLVLPVALLGTVVLGMEAVWRSNLGHGPDWIGMLDFIWRLGAEEIVGQQRMAGPGQAMLAGLLSVAAVAAAIGLREGRPSRLFPLALALVGAYASLNVQHYQRGMGPQAASVALVAAAAGLLGATLAGRWRSTDSGVPQALRLSVQGTAIPLVATTLALPLWGAVDNPLAVRDSAAALGATAAHGLSVEWMLPVADEDLQALLRSVGVTAETPLSFANGVTGNQMGPWWPDGPQGERVLVNPQWTPLYPAINIGWIPEERQAVVMERYLQRRPQAGWLIREREWERSKVDSHGPVWGITPQMFAGLANSHVPTRIVQDDQWELTWWEPAPADVARPNWGWGVPAKLPLDVWVNGVSLATATEPPIWTQFGPGWEILTEQRTDAGRRVDEESELWVYSPGRINATIRLQLGRLPKGMTLAINGAQPVAVDRQDTIEAPVSLMPGWNKVTLTAAVDAAAAVDSRDADIDNEDGTGTGNRKKHRGEPTPSPVASNGDPLAADDSPTVTPALLQSQGAASDETAELTYSVRRIDLITDGGA